MIHKNYNSHDIEATWRQRWEQNGDFKPRQQGEPYCIVLPPPNVTGSLHMGHGFQVTLMDALIRYQRMCGKNVLWQGGTDHAGIATQMVVERQLKRLQDRRLHNNYAVWAPRSTGHENALPVIRNYRFI